MRRRSPPPGSPRLQDRGPGVMPGFAYYSAPKGVATWAGHTNQAIPFFARGGGIASLAAHADVIDPVAGPCLDNTEVALFMHALLEDDAIGVPDAGGPRLSLQSVAPNPFNPATTITFALGEPGRGRPADPGSPRPAGQDPGDGDAATPASIASPGTARTTAVVPAAAGPTCASWSAAVRFSLGRSRWSGDAPPPPAAASAAIPATAARRTPAMPQPMKHDGPVAVGAGVERLGQPAHHEAADAPGGEDDAVVRAEVLQAEAVLGEGGEEREVAAVVEADQGREAAGSRTARSARSAPATTAADEHQHGLEGEHAAVRVGWRPKPVGGDAGRRCGRRRCRPPSRPRRRTPPRRAPSSPARRSSR